MNQDLIIAGILLLTLSLIGMFFPLQPVHVLLLVGCVGVILWKVSIRKE